jgi:hypothetical protein
VSTDKVGNRINGTAIWHLPSHTVVDSRPPNLESKRMTSNPRGKYLIANKATFGNLKNAIARYITMHLFTPLSIIALKTYG